MTRADVIPANTALVLLSLRQVAERTHSSVSYWRRVIRRRDIRVYRIGDLIRIAESDLTAWLAAHAQAAEVGE